MLDRSIGQMPNFIRWVPVLYLTCLGCADARPPLAASAATVAPSWPQLAGNYVLSVQPCELPLYNDLASKPPTGPYDLTWTLTQQEDVLTGTFRSTNVGPPVSGGTVTAKVTQAGKVEMIDLRYSWSSSHVGVLIFTASGEGTADKSQIAGTVSGEQTYTPTFGGVGHATTYRCNGAMMPFRFSRR